MNHLDLSIYVACLASYNNGILYGVWIDATLGEEHIKTEIYKMLSKSPMPMAEEFAIHDYSGFFGLHLHEYSGIEEVAAIAVIIEQHGEIGAEILGYFGNNIEDTKNFLEDNYIGVYSNKIEFAEQLIEEEISGLPSYIQYHFDYESFARDLFISDYTVFEIGGMAHVFSL